MIIGSLLTSFQAGNKVEWIGATFAAAVVVRSRSVPPLELLTRGEASKSVHPLKNFLQIQGWPQKTSLYLKCT